MKKPKSFEKKAKKYETPIADFMLENRKNLDSNFHALPLFHMRPGIKGYERYKDFFGSKYFSMETTITGKTFDSFFSPTKCIKRAQKYAAEAFGARDTLFLTCGTSISNLVVVDALINESSYVLLDRECHQSMHFAVNDKRAKMDYFYSQAFCSNTERKYVHIDKILRLVEKAKNQNTPYNVMIINASSYDGIISNVYEIIKRVHDISPATRFIVDEAWVSAFYFHPSLYKFTAGYAASQLGDQVDIVATQSAHKSLMAMRQASFIHSFASDEITQKLYRSRFKYHSTSPNYPILASIDLARAQMQSYGENLMNEALASASELRKALANDDLLKSYQIANTAKIEEISMGICIEDPLKVHLNIQHLGISGGDLQEYLYYNHGIYFNRHTASTILVNIHIGITQQDIQNLIKSLKVLNANAKAKKICHINVNDFVIQYPPGIPLHTPGEQLNHVAIKADICNKQRNGIHIFQLT